MVDTFRERVDEVLRGDTAMNCSLCKYRAQVLGFEQDVGRAQESHHHHVEGLAESCTLCDRECTGACQQMAFRSRQATAMTTSTTTATGTTTATE